MTGLNITIPAIDEIRAVNVAFPEGGMTFDIAFFTGGKEAYLTRRTVIVRDAAPSTGWALQSARTADDDAFAPITLDPTPTGARPQLMQVLMGAEAAGEGDDASRDAMLAKAVELGLVVIS